MKTEKKILLARKRHWRVRKRVIGTASRPRMSVAFSNQHIYVQFINDEAGVTIAAASTRTKKASGDVKLSANRVGAMAIGRLAAQAAIANGVTEIIFDRGSNRYHWTKSTSKGAQVYFGKTAALAEAARSAGLKF
jgi:large subunit ribosomal protein L18